ncbi:DUF7261 family protein [Halosimplex salinum]|uniref:DUF7261 family protein n=1 Tax=Halosimplex salinum TaxID=1710538 RepID=UPI000F48F438|nr:hypothetical protein [Halosimplex salinum]
MAGVAFGESREIERGQLLLAGAFVLAVALIGLTVVLTSSSYTGTLASQESEVVRGSDAITVRDSVDTDLTRHFRYVFENYAPSNRRAQFKSVLFPIGNETNTHYASRGRMVNVTEPPSGGMFIEGTRFKQVEPFQKFTQPAGGGTGGTDYWYPAENVELRNATIVVNNILGGNQPEEAFNMSLDTPAAAGGNWSFVVYEDFSRPSGEELIIRSRSPTDTVRTCYRDEVSSSSSKKATIHLHNGTVNGDDCDALTPIDPGRHKYTLNFTRGEKVFGKYWMIVDKPPTEGSPTLNSKFAAGTRSTAEPVLFGARVRYRYHSGTVAYETNIDIAHREIS